MAGRLTPLITLGAVSALIPNLRHRLDSNGLIGPFALSDASPSDLQELIHIATLDQNPRNLHARHSLANQIIADSSIARLVTQLFGSGYQLWRTNFFTRQPGVLHEGVPLHHDKHFQSGNKLVDFTELGDHLSVVIGLDTIDSSNGRFVYLPGSHYGSVPGITRDPRPFEKRPLKNHFPSLPSDLLPLVQELNLPAGSFCLFHSALLHGSRPSEGHNGRTSMVARLVRMHCQIPADCATPDEICFYC